MYRERVGDRSRKPQMIVRESYVQHLITAVAFNRRMADPSVVTSVDT